MFCSLFLSFSYPHVIYSSQLLYLVKRSRKHQVGQKRSTTGYPECESLDKEEQLECFQNIVSDRLMTTILEASFVASTPFEESIDLTLKVDKNGAFSLVEAEIPNNVLDALPYLESTLNDAIAKLA